MRELFGTPRGCRRSERVVSFTIWAIVLLHFTACCPELWAELDALDIPIGSKHVSVLELLKGWRRPRRDDLRLPVALGLVEQRLLRAPHLDSSMRRRCLSKFVRALVLASRRADRAASGRASISRC
jgi:hypothetical protein